MKIEETKNKVTQKTPKDYQHLARYIVIKTESTEKLIVPVKDEGKPNIYYANLEKTFTIIHDYHLTISHDGQIRMMKELESKYKIVTAELVTIYLKLCGYSQKKNLPKKRTSSKIEFI